MSAKILFLAGSQRQKSLNKKLATVACDIAKQKGAQATFIDLKDFEMPIYDGDCEEENGLPDNAKKLKELFATHDVLFIASPEYNSSFSPLLKNSLDWISRPHEKGEPPLKAYKGKVAAISAASPGGFGGLRGLVTLRMLLGNIGVTVIPDQVAIGSAFNAFDEAGALNDEKQHKMLENVITSLVNTASALKGQ